MKINKQIVFTLFIATSFFKAQGQAINTSDYMSKKMSYLSGDSYPSVTTPSNVNEFTGGYTFAYATSGTPWHGSLFSFGGFGGQYDTQINADYHQGNKISFRTRNGDIGQWNNWNEIWNSGNLNNSTSDFTAKNIFTSGNVGIGILKPNEKLEVDGAIKISSYSPVLILQRDTKTGGFVQGIQTRLLDGTDNWYFGALLNGQWIVSKGDYQNPKFTVLEGGNVGIGTAQPDSKLTVAGNIHAQEVKVTVNAGVVPDYVFAKDYKLKSLQEIENFINKNNHLPEIPSANEIEKNGLMLAEMNMSLLKKIEELTLYMIEQNKRIITEVEENKLQSTEIKILREKIETFVKK